MKKKTSRTIGTPLKKNMKRSTKVHLLTEKDPVQWGVEISEWGKAQNLGKTCTLYSSFQWSNRSTKYFVKRIKIKTFQLVYNPLWRKNNKKVKILEMDLKTKRKMRSMGQDHLKQVKMKTYNRINNPLNTLQLTSNIADKLDSHHFQAMCLFYF